MGETPSSFEAFLAELSRRRVFRVMAIYGPASFAVLQLADIAFPALDLPAVAIRVLLGLVLAGFPAALLLAWLFEATPGGIRLTRRPAPGELEALASEAAPRRWPSVLLGVAGMLILFGGGWMTGRTSAADRTTILDLRLPETNASAPTLAVLPFESPAGDDTTEVMGVGLADEIRSQLARRPDLRVISRGSGRAAELSLAGDRELAARLGVTHVLTGTVRRDGDQYRVTVSFVDGATATQLWSQSYDASTRVDDQFRVQSDVARRVVEELRTGAVGEAEALESLNPPNSSVAQYWYRRAADRANGNQAIDRDSTSAWLHRATDADPAYAAAWALLARVASLRFFFDEIEGEDVVATDAARRAEDLAPGSPEAWLARGYVARMEEDYEQAALAFRSAVEQAPSMTDAWSGLGTLLMRMGRWPESTQALESAFRLSPRDLAAMSALRFNLSLRAAYVDASALNDRVLRQDPGNHDARSYQPLGLLFAGASPETAEQRAAGLSLDPTHPGESTVLLVLAVLRHDFLRATALLDEGAVNVYEDLVWVPGGEQLISRAQVLGWAGDSAGEAIGDSLLRLLGDVDMERTDYRLARAYGYLLTGQPRDALADVRWVDRRIGGWEGDQLITISQAFELVDLYGRLGELDAGFRTLDELIRRPGRFQSTVWLRLHPAYAPYRADSRFPSRLARRQRFEAEAPALHLAAGPT